MILQVLCLQILHRLKKERVKNGSHCMQHFLTFELTFRKLYRMASKAYLHSFRIFALQCAFKGVVDNIEDLHMNRFHFIAANLTCFGLILYLVVGSHKSEPDVRAR